MQLIHVKQPDTLVEAEIEALGFADRCRAIQITNQESYNLAVDLRERAKEWLRGMKEDESNPIGFAKSRKATYEAYQAVLSQQKAVCGTVEQAVDMFIKPALQRWDREQEQSRIQRQRAAQETVRKELEKQRQQEVKAAKKAGADEESLATIATAPIIVPSVVIAPTFEAAIEMRDNWKARVKSAPSERQNKKLFIQYVAKNCAQNPGLLELIQIDESALNKMAKAQKESLTMPGIEPYNDKIPVSPRR